MNVARGGVKLTATVLLYRQPWRDTLHLLSRAATTLGVSMQNVLYVLHRHCTITVKTPPLPPQHSSRERFASLPSDRGRLHCCSTGAVPCIAVPCSFHTCDFKGGVEHCFLEALGLPAVQAPAR